jgi:hypothetical protein
MVLKTYIGNSDRHSSLSFGLRKGMVSIPIHPRTTLDPALIKRSLVLRTDHDTRDLMQAVPVRSSELIACRRGALEAVTQALRCCDRRTGDVQQTMNPRGALP